MTTKRIFQNWKRINPFAIDNFKHQKRNYFLQFKKEPFQPRVGRYPTECDTPLEAVQSIRSNMRS